MPERCETCRFWPAARNSRGTYGMHGHHTDGSVSDCRRYPPRDTDPSREHYDRNAVWPRTLKTDWCGEWKLAETENATN